MPPRSLLQSVPQAHREYYMCYPSLVVTKDNHQSGGPVKHNHISIHTKWFVFLTGQGLARSFFVSASVWDFRTSDLSVQSLRSSAAFRGAAPIPPALPFPFCSWPRTRTGVKMDKREVYTILYFERSSQAIFFILTYGEFDTI